MRIVLIGLGGGTATALAFGISRLSDDRSVRDIFLFIAIIAFVLTVAVVIALGAVTWEERSRRPRWPGTADERCSSCNGRMTRLGGLWICPDCDRVPV